MQSIAQVMKGSKTYWEQRIQQTRQRLAMESSQESEKPFAPTVQCEKCNDFEFIFIEENKVTPCKCWYQKQIERRIKNAMIPEQLTHATFENYIVEDETQRLLRETAEKYLKNFDQIWRTEENSLGFIAELGETKIRKEPDPQKRAQLEMEYNSYGLGKTHLTVAIARELLEKHGRTVLIISDPVFMDEVSLSKSMGDGGEEYESKIHAATSVDVLVWDDLGKSKWSEAKEQIYYRIIDERWRKQLPIIFTSNEDMQTLDDKIGPAAMSRLMGMCKNYILHVSGTDYRVKA